MTYKFKCLDCSLMVTRLCKAGHKSSRCRECQRIHKLNQYRSPPDVMGKGD